jgi:hypothetical protein
MFAVVHVGGVGGVGDVEDDGDGRPCGHRDRRFPPGRR